MQISWPSNANVLKFLRSLTMLSRFIDYHLLHLFCYMTFPFDSKQEQYLSNLLDLRLWNLCHSFGRITNVILKNELKCIFSLFFESTENNDRNPQIFESPIERTVSEKLARYFWANKWIPRENALSIFRGIYSEWPPMQWCHTTADITVFFQKNHEFITLHHRDTSLVVYQFVCIYRLSDCNIYVHVK